MYTDMSRFFNAIASRMWKENDLSDMTFALCEGNLGFKQFFLDFFFGADVVRAEEAKMTREYTKDGARPDFWIEASGQLYIVEVKIWDGSHHFKQYLPFVKNDKKRLGYIAAYTIVADNDGTIVNDGSFPGLKTWSQFLDALKEAGVQESGLGIGDPAIVGYMGFVRQVCGIGEKYPEIEPISAGFLCQLDRICEKYLNAVKYCSGRKLHKCEFYARSSTASDFSYRKGVFFQFDYRGETAYGFIGLYFGGAKKSPAFVIGFENKPGWAQNICTDFKAIAGADGLWFYPDQETIMGEDDQLGKYLGRILDGLNGGKLSGLSTEEHTFEDFKVLKQVQLFDRHLRMGSLDFSGSVEGIEYSLKYYANVRSWDGAVGEYFEISIPVKDIITWGWTGLTYKDGCVKGVLRFRNDWAGPFRNSDQIVLWDGTGSIMLDQYLDALKKALEKLVFEKVSTALSK